MVELLVVIAIIAVLSAILFSVFAQAKAAGKKTVCLSNLRQTGMAVQLYLADFDGFYPQTRKSTPHPEIDDVSGQLEEPDYGSAFRRLIPYIKSPDLLRCPADVDPNGVVCDVAYPDHPEVHSFVVNGYFVFGLNQSVVERPADTIILAERRSGSTAVADPFCTYLYRPWFNSSNALAPVDDMDEEYGAIATRQHGGQSVFGFVDGHAKTMVFAQTYSVGGSVDLHRP